MSRIYGLGRLFAPDDRDYKMRAAFRLAEVAVQPRKQPYKLGPTLNQGEFPHCVGYSIRHKLIAAPIMVKADVGITPVELYAGAQDNDEWPGTDYEGTSVRGGFKFAQSVGAIASYVFAATANEARKFMRDGFGTVVAGTNWYAEMFYPVNGVLPKVPKSKTPVGGHAWHLAWTFQAGDARVPGLPKAWGSLDLSQYDVIQNSWGAASEPDGWPGSERFMGQGGCVLILKTETDRLFREDGEFGAGLERKAKA